MLRRARGFRTWDDDSMARAAINQPGMPPGDLAWGEAGFLNGAFLLPLSKAKRDLPGAGTNGTEN